MHVYAHVLGPSPAYFLLKHTAWLGQVGHASDVDTVACTLLDVCTRAGDVKLHLFEVKSSPAQSSTVCQCQGLGGDRMWQTNTSTQASCSVGSKPGAS